MGASSSRPYQKEPGFVGAYGYNGCLYAMCGDAWTDSSSNDGWPIRDPAWEAVRGAFEDELNSDDMKALEEDNTFCCGCAVYYGMHEDLKSEWCPRVTQDILKPRGFACHSYYWESSNTEGGNTPHLAIVITRCPGRRL
mmetsp:Transcript_47614/g.87503  ORF Transcript_47614/g.87503 Transcript_47614/m.87503 type:complete len:139 (-) Transcript_47614:181-597(-)